MKRINLATGLTAILVLLLLISGYAILTTKELTADVDRLISRNYVSLRALRELRASMTRINAHYRGAIDASSIPKGMQIFEHEKGLMEKELRQLKANLREREEEDKFNKLELYLHEYVEIYEEYLQLIGRKSRDAEDQFARLTERIATVTGSVAEICAGIAEDHDFAIEQQRAEAVHRGRNATVVLFALSIAGLGVYGFASYSITRGIYQPLRALRDGIRELKNRQFDAAIRVEGGEEIAQIVEEFNGLAGILKRYLNESDERAVRAAHDCRAALAALPYPVFIVAPDYSLRLTNPSADRILAQLEIEGALPSSVRRLIDARSDSRSPLDVSEMKEAIEMDLEGDSHVKSRHYFLPQVVQIGDVGREAEGWAIMLVDVTKSRRLDDAKSKALSTLGHEIKTPVTGIRMTLHLLLEEKIGALSEDQKELIQGARDDCERLLLTLQALMEMARLEGGRTPVRLQHVAPEVIVRQALGLFGTLAKAKGISLVIQNEVPATVGIHADPLHAERVIGNFISNAIKYGVSKADIVVRVSERTDGMVRFSVINKTDAPLSEAEQVKVFAPFYRRPGVAVEGAGLGLAIAKEIAHLHGGRVGVWSSGGETEFYLDLRRSEKSVQST